MRDLKLQMQLFAILGKLRKLISTWLVSGYKSPGAENALVIRLEAIIQDIETHTSGNDDIADT